MDEETVTIINGQLSAVTFIVEILLANLISGQPSTEARAKFISDLRRVSKLTDHLKADDEHHAAAISDYAIDVQARIEHILDRAIGRIGKS